MRLCTFLHEKFASCRHWEGNVCVELIGPGKATNVSYWKALDGGEVVSTGTHRDTLKEESPGHWRVEKRVIEHTWTKAGGHHELLAPLLAPP